MKVKIKKEEPTKQMLREAKLKKILKDDDKIKTPFHFSFVINRESEEESLEDFHLFCISITRDLLNSKFKTNEMGVITYNIENVEIENTLYNLQQLFNAIGDKKDEKLKNNESTL